MRLKVLPEVRSFRQFKFYHRSKPAVTAGLLVRPVLMRPVKIKAGGNKYGTERTYRDTCEDKGARSGA